MPTVNNHDVMDCLSWGGNAKERLVATKCSSDGFGVNGMFSPRTNNQNLIAEEHDYATPLRFVSGNSYYGHHPINVTPDDSSDCLMDTSEHNSTPEGFAASNTTKGRKRNVAYDVETHHLVAKRARQDKAEEASTVAEVQGLGLLAPSFGVQTQNHPQNSDLSNLQVPASSSVLMDTVSPHKSDAVTKDENKRAEQMQLRIVENNDMATLESLLKYTHGCDYYNYALSDL